MIVGASSFASPIEDLVFAVDSIELYIPKMSLYEGRDLKWDRVRNVTDKLSAGECVTSLHAPYHAVVHSYPASLRVDTAHMNGRDFGLMEEAIDLAVYFNSELVVLHPGLVGNDRKKSLIDMVTNLRRLSGYAEDRGIMLGLENKEGTAPDNLCCEADELVWAVDQVGSDYLGVTFDVGHANLTSGGISEKVHSFMNKVKEKVVHVHVHDNMGIWTRDYDGDMHMAPGRGTVDMSVIEKLGFCGIHNLEVFTMDDVVAGKKLLQAM